MKSLGLSQSEIDLALRSILSEFLPYQRRYIADRTRHISVEKAVRIGITYAHSYKAAVKRVFRSPDKRPIRELFASKNLKTASEYLTYHRRWAEAFNCIFEGLIDMSGWTTEKCVYPGGEILVMSSGPDSFRGMEGDVTLDEFAFHEQQEALYSAAQSRMQWLPDGQLTLISSHSHPETVFARVTDEWRTDKTGDFKVYTTTLEDAVRQGLALRVPGIHQKLLVKKAA